MTHTAMTPDQIADEVAALDKMTKAIWPQGWASIICDGRDWTVQVWDDDIKNRRFEATIPSAALAQARDYLERNPPMTESRLAAILGIEMAA